MESSEKHEASDEISQTESTQREKANYGLGKSNLGCCMSTGKEKKLQKQTSVVFLVPED